MKSHRFVDKNVCPLSLVDLRSLDLKANALPIELAGPGMLLGLYNINLYNEFELFE